MNMAVTDVMDSVGASWPDAHVNADAMARLAAGMHEFAGVENLGAPFCMTVEAEALGAEVCLGTKETEPRVTTYAMDDLRELDRLGSMNPARGRAATVAEATRLMSTSYPVVPTIADLTGPISLATSLVEPLQFYRAMRREPAAAHALLEVATEAAIVFGDALVDAGAVAACIADPSATGELIGGRLFTQFALPYVNQIVTHFAARDIPSIVHICGNIRTLGEALPRIAAPVISIDSVVGLNVLRRLAPSHLTMGNVSTYLLEYGKPGTLAKVAASKTAAGVDILAPACGIGARTPLRNIRALADAVAGNNESEARRSYVASA